MTMSESPQIQPDQPGSESRAAAGGPGQQDSLRRGFDVPPRSARPQVWWHWMDGNVDLKGISLDLEWISRVGVRGVQMFEGAMGTPDSVQNRLMRLSPEWEEAVRHAVSSAAGLGMDFTLATSPGWSATGGPWVSPAQAMKKLVWSTSFTSHGEEPRVVPAPPSCAGPYQDIPQAAIGAVAPGDTECFEDIAVLAFPMRAGHRAHRPVRVITSDNSKRQEELALLTDGQFWPGLGLKMAPDSETAWITMDFGSPVTSSAVTVGLPGRRGFGAPLPPLAALESSDDGATFTPVIQIPHMASQTRTAGFEPVTARFFRLSLRKSEGPTLPPVAPGVKHLSFPAPKDDFQVSEVQLWDGPRISQAEEKAGFAAASDYYNLEGPGGQTTDKNSPHTASRVSEVLDLTPHLNADGVLAWEPPPGDWTILRMGWSPTGHTNGPAAADATGLEVDKLDAGLVRQYMDSYLGQYEKALGGNLAAAGLTGLLSDSIEAGFQNWTRNMRAEFHSRRGYDMLPWLPALAGIPVEGAKASDEFLWDYRRTLAELLAENHYGTIAAVAKERGLEYYAEALEDKRPQLGDDLEMRSHADVPMGAMWCFSADTGPKPTYVADIKGASSVSHVYGKRLTGAESMSAFGQPWAYTPRTLKPVLDLEFALGVNTVNIHTSPHQPSTSRAPGIALSPLLGQTFTRHETWAEMAGPWIDYMARNCFMLQQGTYRADVAYFVGEEAPVTGLFGERHIDVPDGYDYDFVGLDAVSRHLTVVDGALISTGGVSYQCLYLGGSSSRMTIKAIRSMTKLVRAGATLLGARPLRSPSHSDTADEFETAVEELWGPKQTGPAGRKVGNGSVYDVADLLEGLRAAGVEPSWNYATQAADPELKILHRTVTTETGKTEIYFISNQRERPETVRLSVRDGGQHAELWDAYLGSRNPVEFDSGTAGTQVQLSLDRFGSVFLVLSPEPGTGNVTSDEPADVIALQGAWTLSMRDGSDQSLTTLNSPQPWSSRAESRHYSGTGVYRTAFEISPEWLDDDTKVILDLGEVGQLAEVHLNGALGGTAWTLPYSVDITSAVRGGKNDLEVAVTSSWRNRLIGDAAPGAVPVLDTRMNFYSPEAIPDLAGLAGPVCLRIMGARDKG